MPIPELRPTLVIDNRDVPHLLHMESRGRTSHVHWDGCEVQRQFYVNHYWAAPHVCAALLGFVLQEGAVYKRYLPANDPIYNQILYCNEARWEHVDKQSISAAAPINAVSGNVSVEQAYSHFMFEVNRIGENKVTVDNGGLITEGVPGGAFITASYRPLISAYYGDDYSSGPGGPIPRRERQFDFLDPQIVPSTRSVPWPMGLAVKPGGDVLNALDVPDAHMEPLIVPTLEFTVRRMFLGRVPYEILNPALGTVNNADWPAGNYRAPNWPWTIPQFPAETLRFDSYQVIPHWSQSSTFNTWYEVKLHFLARAFRGSPFYDQNGVRSALGDVTWNHAFFAAVGERGGVAWWYVSKRMTVIPVFTYAPVYTPISFHTLFAPVNP